MRRAALFVGEIGLSAIATIAVQAIAILFLEPADYGRFAVLYLAYALATSVLLSVACEPLSRRAPVALVSTAGFSSVVYLVAVSVASVTSVMAWGIGLTPAETALSACAVFFASVRFALRYDAARKRQTARLALPDMVNACVTVATFFAILNFADGIFAVLLSWCVGVALAALLSGPAMKFSIRSVRTWFRDGKKEIRPLLVDSVMLDIGTIVLPYAVSFGLGAAQFGIYRAVTNLAVPVRLVLAPIRPLISSRRARWHTRARTFGVVTLSAAVLAVAVWGALEWVATSAFLAGSTLHVAAEEVSVPTALFAAATTLGTYYYFVARAYLSARPLVLLRIAQLVGAVALTMAGLALYGMMGAVWGMVIAALIHAVAVPCVVWWAVQQQERGA